MLGLPGCRVGRAGGGGRGAASGRSARHPKTVQALQAHCAERIALPATKKPRRIVFVDALPPPPARTRERCSGQPEGALRRRRPGAARPQTARAAQLCPRLRSVDRPGVRLRRAAIVSPLIARARGEHRNSTTSATTSSAVTRWRMLLVAFISASTCAGGTPRAQRSAPPGQRCARCGSPGYADHLDAGRASSSARFLVSADTATLRMLPTVLPVWRAASHDVDDAAPAGLAHVGRTARAVPRKNPSP